MHSDASKRMLYTRFCKLGLLSGFLAVRPFEEGTALAFMRSAAEGVAQLHEAGYSHNALSCDSFLVDTRDLLVEPTSPLLVRLSRVGKATPRSRSPAVAHSDSTGIPEPCKEGDVQELVKVCRAICDWAPTAGSFLSELRQGVTSALENAQSARQLADDIRVLCDTRLGESDGANYMVFFRSGSLTPDLSCLPDCLAAVLPEFVPGVRQIVWQYAGVAL